MKIKIDYQIERWELLAFLLPFSLYLWSLAPGITFYDSAEFITAAHFMGSAHSPGYPLFLLYVKPFTWLPVGNIAFRVNLATAVSAAMACFSVYLIIKSILRHSVFCRDPEFSSFAVNMAALSGAMLFAVSPRLWLQSNHDKPYPLLAFITAVMLLFMLRWRESVAAGDEQPVWWYLTSFFAGLATGAHQTIILMLPGLLIFIFMTSPKAVRRVREWLLSGAIMLAGGAVQLYLPFRASANTRQNWGDPDSLSRFLWHILRHGYPEEQHSRDFRLLLQQLGAFDIPNEFGWIGLVLIFAGIWACWLADRAFLVYCVVSLIAFWALIAGYFNPVAEVIFLTEEFYTPLYLLSSVLISLGLYALAARGAESAQKPEKYELTHSSVLAVLFMLIPAFQLVTNFAEQDQHKNYLAQDYAVNSIRSIPEDSVLFTWGDSGAFPLWYLQGVERMREDIDIAHIPHLVFPWYQHDFPRLAHAFSGIKQGEQAESVFLKLASYLKSERTVMMDFSTRHSINWSNIQTVQYGILFGSEPVHVKTDETSVWDLYVLHRMSPDGWTPDSDSQKALIIHAYSLMQSAEDLARKGDSSPAGVLLEKSERIMPEWRDRLSQMRRRYAISTQSKELK